ncbi:DNA polymerase II [Colwellia sp. D2M02]|uniref:DNA polymerase II n=1 Tax=Colwellia sp. D2M02 TaxID=2841562 RepID=UPI00209051BD|nr:DNA polymerase II [Colwellia sp. D2M02]
MSKSMMKSATAQTTQLAQRGFLLTRQVEDSQAGLQITLWLKTLSGSVKLIITDEQAVFFIEDSQVMKAKSLLTTHNIPVVKFQSLAMKTFNGNSVSGIYFTHLRHFYRARELLTNAQVKCYEDDIRPDDRFLMERFITADLDFIGNPVDTDITESSSKGSIENYQLYRQAKCKASTSKSTLTLKMLSLDLECSMQGELFSIGLYSERPSTQSSKSISKEDTYKRVLMIGEPEETSNDYIVWVQDEKALLVQLMREIVAFDPDVFIGWNVINFDFKLLQKRFDHYGLAFTLGRDNSIARWRNNRNSTEQYFIEIAGRLVLDGIDLLKTATYSFSSFSLDNVANELLGIGKKVVDVDNRIQEIVDNFNHNKPALAAYNLEDCRLVWLIFEKTALLAFAQLRAQLTGLAIDRIGGSVAAFTNLYLPKLHRSGYVAPNMGDGMSALVSPGGYVMESVPGLYSNVLVLDFKSLYPSIIRTFKIDPMGLIEGLAEQAHYQASQLDEGNTSTAVINAIKGFDGAYFSRTQHFLPDIIESLWLERDKAKQQKNAALSQAIKIIMNSFYGILGSTGCRFFDPRLAGSITKRSHEILKITSQWIEQAGYQVIYGDTDSIFVSIGEDKSLMQGKELGYQLQTLINQNWQQALKEEYQLDCHLEIEFETLFTKFLMPTIRGKDIGTKKRYAGLVVNLKELTQAPTLMFKGLESVRTDWTALAKDFQKNLYLKVFTNQPIDDYINEIVAQVQRGNCDGKLIYRKRIRRALNDYIKNVPPHVKAARLADAHNEKMGKPLRYQQRGWIEYFITLNGPQVKEQLCSPLDYQFYIDRQIAAVADGILPFIGKSFDEITNKQLGLF